MYVAPISAAHKIAFELCPTSSFVRLDGSGARGLHLLPVLTLLFPGSPPRCTALYSMRLAPP